jgi:hypothetical protein
VKNPLSDLRPVKMEANNAESSTTETTTESSTTETTSPSVGIFDKTPEPKAETNAVDTDTEGTTEVSAIEEDKTSTDEESSTSEESTESTEDESEPVYLVGDKEITASRIKELEESGLRQADYTKKSQANAEERKVNEAKSLELDGLKVKLSDAVDKLEANISTEYNKEDMDYLRDNDPSEYLRKQEEQKQKQSDVNKAKEGLKVLKEQADNEKLVKEQQLLLDSQPTWIDEAVRKADISLIETYVKDSEMTAESFNALGNHQLMNMALDAARYKALQKDTEVTKKAVQKAPNVIKARVKEVKTKPKSTVSQRFYG